MDYTSVYFGINFSFFSLLRFYKTDETFNMDIYYKGNVDKKNGGLCL